MIEFIYHLNVTFMKKQKLFFQTRLKKLFIIVLNLKFPPYLSP